MSQVARDVYGLIGYPLGHSFSKRYFTEKFERGQIQAEYELFPIVDLDILPDLIHRHPNLRGLNVTIPHKESVIPLLDSLDETAQAVGAVNCIKIDADRRLKGYNTDIIGFRQSLLQFLTVYNVQPDQLQALVLGTGGAAKAVVFVLQALRIPLQYVSRQPDAAHTIEYGAVADFLASTPASHTLIINTTPVGMYPNTQSCPALPYKLLGPQHLVFDLVYNPLETLLLQQAKAQGCATQHGLDMLHFQAEAAWEIWQIKQ